MESRRLASRGFRSNNDRKLFSKQSSCFGRHLRHLEVTNTTHVSDKIARRALTPRSGLTLIRRNDTSVVAGRAASSLNSTAKRVSTIMSLGHVAQRMVLMRHLHVSACRVGMPATPSCCTGLPTLNFPGAHILANECLQHDVILPQEAACMAVYQSCGALIKNPYTRRNLLTQICTTTVPRYFPVARPGFSALLYPPPRPVGTFRAPAGPSVHERVGCGAGRPRRAQSKESFAP